MTWITEQIRTNLNWRLWICWFNVYFLLSCSIQYGQSMKCGCHQWLSHFLSHCRHVPRPPVARWRLELKRLYGWMSLTLHLSAVLYDTVRHCTSAPSGACTENKERLPSLNNLPLKAPHLTATIITVCPANFVHFTFPEQSTVRKPWTNVLWLFPDNQTCRTSC